MKIDPRWHRVGHCVCLIRAGGNPKMLKDRYAFIEKTPRIRIRDYPRSDFSYSGLDPKMSRESTDWLNWAEGYKGSGADDEDSRKWCVEALKLFGFEFEEHMMMGI